MLVCFVLLIWLVESFLYYKGVNHQELVDVVNKRFCSIPEGLTSTVKKAEYVGGTGNYIY